MLRFASASDAAAILAIYAPYIRETSLTFETEVPTEKEFAKRISDYLQNWPWLVWEENGQITGYAYASRYRERAGYQWSVECSVYMDEPYFGKGLARKLYSALFDILRKQNFYTVYAVINLPNERSVAFHERMGFIYFATYKNVGYKLGKWKNVGWWQLKLKEYDHEPAPPILLNDIEATVIKNILSENEE